MIRKFQPNKAGTNQIKWMSALLQFGNKLTRVVSTLHLFKPCLPTTRKNFDKPGPYLHRIGKSSSSHGNTISTRGHSHPTQRKDAHNRAIHPRPRPNWPKSGKSIPKRRQKIFTRRKHIPPSRPKWLTRGKSILTSAQKSLRRGKTWPHTGKKTPKRRKPNKTKKLS